MAVRAILFDLGDTLLDFDPVDPHVVARIAAARTYEYLQSRGCVLPSFRRYYHTLVWIVRLEYVWSKLTRREINCLNLLHQFCKSRKLPRDEKTLRELAWMWYEPMVPYSRVVSDLIPTLRDLRQSGLKLGLISNTFIPGIVLDKHLELAGLLEFFPVRVYSSEVGIRKPDRRIFQVALKQLDVAPEDAWFVGDLDHIDIAGAHRAGMRAILRQPDSDRQRHTYRPDLIIREIADLRPLLLGQPTLARA